MISRMSWSTTSTAQPSSRRSDRITSSSSSDSASFRPAAGSSRKRNRGCVAIALAISTRRWSPYGSVLTIEWAYPSSPSSASAALLTRRGRMNPPERTLHVAAVSTFSSAVMSLNRRMFWNVRARPARATLYDGSVDSDFSSIRTRPEEGRMTPEMTLISVVLPEPFGPITARMSPSSSARLTSESACTPAKSLLTDSTSSFTCAVEPPWLLLQRQHLPGIEVRDARALAAHPLGDEDVLLRDTLLRRARVADHAARAPHVLQARIRVTDLSRIDAARLQQCLLDLDRQVAASGDERRVRGLPRRLLVRGEEGGRAR